MSIRFKVVLPYLLLTLVIAITGVYVVTQLVVNSLDDRLKNYMFEAGRVVSDGIVKLESTQIITGRNLTFTRGMAEALAGDDPTALISIVQPYTTASIAENLVVINVFGEEVLHLLRLPDKSMPAMAVPSGYANLAAVQDLLLSNNPTSNPKRMLAINSLDGRFYYCTVFPVAYNGKLAGAIIVGTSLDKILPELKNTSLADVIFYGSKGNVIATTLGGQVTDPNLFASLAITEADYQTALVADNLVYGQNIFISGREYGLARGSMKVGNDRLGVFAVVYPRDFVIVAGESGRNTYTFYFALVMVLVVVVGYGISRLIVNPLLSLMHTSQAIARGDLNQRSGISSTDEIGVLANTFDSMTEKLQLRTVELEKTNRTLEQMDRSKVNFISVSAHELRTPLTLINGYSQILELRANKDPELAPLAKGILEGSTRMTEIVNSMLDVSRIDNQTLQVVQEPLEIKHLVTRVRDTFEQALEQRHLTLNEEGLEDLPSIQADPDLLFKVFYHLVMNAIKYTPDGRWIKISGHVVAENPENPEIEVVIADSGIGIDSQHLETIFEKFFQLGEVHYHSSGKTKFKGGGPGLGLAIAQGIVQAHQGRIWAESSGHDESKNPGSQFHVRLPVNGLNHDNA